MENEHKSSRIKHIKAVRPDIVKRVAYTVVIIFPLLPKQRYLCESPWFRRGSPRPHAAPSRLPGMTKSAVIAHRR